MIYLLETELQDNKSLYISLRYVFGIGSYNSTIICKKLGFSKNFKVSELTEEQKRQFIIKDNVGFGEWDWDLLANDWNSQELSEWGLDVWQAELQEEKDKEEKDGEVCESCGKML